MNGVGLKWCLNGIVARVDHYCSNIQFGGLKALCAVVQLAMRKCLHKLSLAVGILALIYDFNQHANRLALTN